MMCDLLINNISNDTFMHEVTDELQGRFRGLKEVVDPLQMASEIYNEEPPKIALIDCDDVELKTILGFICPYVGYVVGFTDNYNDKKFVKKMYMQGLSDVRPKNDINSLEIAIRPVIKRRQTMTQRKISLA